MKKSEKNRIFLKKEAKPEKNRFLGVQKEVRKRSKIDQKSTLQGIYLGGDFGTFWGPFLKAQVNRWAILKKVIKKHFDIFEKLALFDCFLFFKKFQKISKNFSVFMEIASKKSYFSKLFIFFKI